MSIASVHPPMMPSPSPALRWISLTAATVAVDFGGCGCAPAPSSSTSTSSDDSALVASGDKATDDAPAAASAPAGTYALVVD